MKCQSICHRKNIMSLVSNMDFQVANELFINYDLKKLIKFSRKCAINIY